MAYFSSFLMPISILNMCEDFSMVFCLTRSATIIYANSYVRLLSVCVGVTGKLTAVISGIVFLLTVLYGLNCYNKPHADTRF